MLFRSSSTKSRPTVADAFRHQLASLVDLLSKVNPWYVRCLKPNLEKSARGYDNRQVLMQLRYLGMSDLIRIRREGYPIHLTKHQFVCRYRCLMLKHLRINPTNLPIRLDEKTLHSCCIRIIDNFKLDPRHYRIGKSMVLLRSVLYQPLEDKRNRLFIEAATKIQSVWRGSVQRRDYVKKRRAARRIQETFRAYRGHLLYMRKKRAALTIQAYCRGMFAREIANAMREIKRTEENRIRKIQEEQRMREQQLEIERLRLHDEALKADMNNNETQIIVTDAPELDNLHGNVSQDGRSLRDESSPCSNISPMVSSSASWFGQDVSEARQKLINARDRKEMEELVKVLESHGISLDALEQGDEKVYADFERLYDVLGTQLNTACDTQSISTSVIEDDRCSFATTGTNCDGDSMSQISSTVTDDPTANSDKQADDEKISGCSETVNENQNAVMHNDENYHSNSVESIVSINSTASINCTQLPTTPQRTEAHLNQDVGDDSKLLSTTSSQQPQDHQTATRTSTFTGNPVLVSGSKMVTNGRPLTRIEEEPNSICGTPKNSSKT